VTETVLSTTYFISMILLLFAAFLTFVRLARGPGLADRVAALDMLAVILIAIMFVHAMATGQHVYLDAVLALAMVSFLSTIGFSRYLEERGRL